MSNRTLADLNRVQRTPTLMVDTYMKQYGFQTEEAQSVVRTLHALHGAEIKNHLATYLDSDEAWSLSEEAFSELVSAQGN